MDISIIIIIGMVALVALAFWIRTKQLHRAAVEIVERFREHGAINEKKAKTLEELDIRSKPKHAFVLRDNQVEALTQLLKRGIICPIEQEEKDAAKVRLYLDENVDKK